MKSKEGKKKSVSKMAKNRKQSLRKDSLSGSKTLLSKANQNQQSNSDNLNNVNYESDGDQVKMTFPDPKSRDESPSRKENQRSHSKKSKKLLDLN